MIPLMVYASPALREEHPEVYEQIVAAKDRKIMTDLLANSICGLLGVKTKYYNARQDFFSSEYAMPADAGAGIRRRCVSSESCASGCVPLEV